MTIPNEVAAVLANIRNPEISGEYDNRIYWAGLIESALTKAEAVGLDLSTHGINRLWGIAYYEVDFGDEGKGHYVRREDFERIVRALYAHAPPAVPVESLPEPNGKLVAWWNGISPGLDGQGNVSISWGADGENTYHDIPLYDGYNPIHYQTPAEPVASVPDGWSGWATQYPGKLPKLFGAREIAKLNHYPEEGARLIFLRETAHPESEGSKPISAGDRVIWKNDFSSEHSGSVVEVMQPETTYSVMLDNGALITVHDQNQIRKTAPPTNQEGAAP